MKKKTYLAVNRIRNKLDIKLGCSNFFFPDAQNFGDFSVDIALFYTSSGSSKNN